MHAQVIKYASDDNGVVYTNLETALQKPDMVYRLKLSGKPKCDSIPKEILQLKNLRELTLRNCKLLIINQDIALLSNLQYLNLENNRLVHLPETLGQLTELKSLIINRNMIETLPESIANLTNLQIIDAWDNPLYKLPESIVNLANTLKTIDLRQVPLKGKELETMEILLPKTEILITNICECKDGR